MALTENDIKQITPIIAGVLNRRAWGVSMGHGTFVTMEFGDPVRTEPPRRTHGEWHLWICSVAWRLEGLGEPLVGFDDDGELLQEAVDRLNGRVLQSFEIHPPAGDAVLRFDGDLVLRLFTINIQADETQWMLYTPNRRVLTLGAGCTWSYQDSAA